MAEATVRRRVLVATGDTLGAAMAGPAIRALAIARALSVEHDVHLVSTERADLQRPDIMISAVDDPALEQLVRWCDIFIVQGWVLAGRPNVKRASDAKVVVVDLYDPMHLEQLEQARDDGAHGWRAAVTNTTAVLNEQVRRGDWFMCASERQRDFWLGHLAALGRVNPATYESDHTLRRLIDVVPFGIEDEAPVRTGPGWRGVLPGVEASDKVIVWGGGIWNWFDPLTLLRAVDALRHDVNDVRLVFMGVAHPNPLIPQMDMAVAARTLSYELGLTGRHVFFNEIWMPYDARQNALLDGDIGVSTHFDHIESEFSYRTRVLDYFWADLPVVVTRGDALADAVGRDGLGLVVPATDVEALRDALHQLLTDGAMAEACRRNVELASRAMRWSVVLAPLLEFCRHPHRAPDLVDPAQAATLQRVHVGIPPRTGLLAFYRRVLAAGRRPNRVSTLRRAVARKLPHQRGRP
jgi:glycosyltransferase involved in cell wall biosynthesis